MKLDISNMKLDIAGIKADIADLKARLSRVEKLQWAIIDWRYRHPLSRILLADPAGLKCRVARLLLNVPVNKIYYNLCKLIVVFR